MPTLVKDISGVGQVSCGSAHTLALSLDGRTVWSFGSGDNGGWYSDLSLEKRLPQKAMSLWQKSLYFVENE